MLCKITASFRASATRALPAPDRLAIACAQSFRPEARLIRFISTTAASYMSVRASVSPHFDVLPLRSFDAHQARALLGARAQLVGMKTRLSNHIRGVLKTFGMPPG